MAIGAFFSRFMPLIQKFFKTTKTTVKNVLVLVMVFGLERIFEKDVFECPNSKYFMYGNLFLFGPAICLFMLTLLLNNTFWDVVTGCRLAHFSRRWMARNLVRIVFQALLPPGVWIVVSLIQTHYYVCLKLGPKKQALKTALKNRNGSSTADITMGIEEEFNKARAMSHILAWLLFDSLVIFAFLVVCFRRCWFMRAEGELPHLQMYDKLEANSAAEEFKTLMEKRAETEGKKFVQDGFEMAKERTHNEYKQLEIVRNELLRHYPRSDGDLSKPYRVDMEHRVTMNSNGHTTANAAEHGVSHEMIQMTSTA